MIIINNNNNNHYYKIHRNHYNMKPVNYYCYHYHYYPRLGPEGDAPWHDSDPSLPASPRTAVSARCASGVPANDQNKK